MDTHFAPAGRTSDDQLHHQVEAVAHHPVIDEVLCSVSGLITVLNEQRQIVALNDDFLAMLGIEDAGEVLGLRLGETLGCVHSAGPPDGCGTTEYCSTCGAAIAVVASLRTDRTVERRCALTVERDDHTVDFEFLVRSHPVRIAERRFLLVFLRDITLEQQRAALERVFFHDVNNILASLLGASELLVRRGDHSRLTESVRSSARLLAGEVAAQRCLFDGDRGQIRPLRQRTTVNLLLAELRSLYTNHPAANDRVLRVAIGHPDWPLHTDFPLTLRVLGNMVTNALEASPAGGEVRVDVQHRDHATVFRVHNDGVIPCAVARRVFQRHFTTRKEPGRGLGTFSMRLFGEQVLGGSVTFDSSPERGTEFRFELPDSPRGKSDGDRQFAAHSERP